MDREQSLRDSGEREAFDSGGVREPSTGRGRFDLLPPHPVLRLAQHYENGAIKYADRNWEKGIPPSRCMNSAIRHIMQYMDDDRVEDHLAAAVWNLFAVMHFEQGIRDGKYSADLWDMPVQNPIREARDGIA